MKIKIDFKSFKFHRYYLIFIVGFLINFQPSGIFNYEYLIKFKDKITKNNIGQDLYPLTSYSACVQSILILFTIDLLNYTPFVIIYVVSSLIYCCLLIWTDTLVSLQIAHVIFGSYLATDAIYLIFIFIFIDNSNYNKIASFVRVATLIANTVAYLLSQLLISLEYLNYEQLHYITLAANLAALIVVVFLPFPKDNRYYKLIKKSNENRFGAIWKEFFNNFKEAFADKYIVKWVLWYSLSLSAFRPIVIYIQQLLYYNKIHDGILYYNGVIGGLSSLFGIFGALIGGYNKLDWRYTGDLILTITSLLQGFMLLFMSQIGKPLSFCIFFIIFTCCYYYTTTSLIGELLRNLKKIQFGIVFGVIYCFGSLLQTVIIILINDHVGFELNVRDQFFYYGNYHLFIAFVFIIIGLISWIAKRTYPI